MKTNWNKVRLLSALSLAVCNFLPLIGQPNRPGTEPFIVVTFLFHSFVDNNFHPEKEIILLLAAFTWPVVLCLIERGLRGGTIKFLVLFLEGFLGVLTLEVALYYSLLAITFGPLNIGSVLALTSFGVFSVSSLLLIYTWLKSQGWVEQSKE